MTKKKIIIVCLIVLSLFSVVYLAFSLKKVAVTKPVADMGGSPAGDKTGGVDLKKLETGYKTQVKFIVNEYETMVSRTETTAEDIAKLKDKLTGLSVPTDLRNLHLDLVVAFSQMENYLKNDGEEDR